MTTPEPGLRARHWVYLDDARTHEVHAQVEPRAADVLLSTTEFPAGSRDPTEALMEERRLASAADAAKALLDIEERLALSGTYYRADVEDMRWSLLAAPAGARRIDLRAHEVALPGSATGARMSFHHFHATGGGREKLLIMLPRTDLGTPRSILAQLDFDFPSVESGDLKVLHPRLAAATLKSAVVRQHVDLPRRGYSKLIEPKDYESAFGNGWVERTREVFRRATARVLGMTDVQHPAPPPRPSDHPRLPAERLAHALRTEKVLTLRSRFLTPQDAEGLFEGGELAIRRFVQGKRRRADHSIAYDLSILEATLLVEYALRKRSHALLDEEGSKLLRYASV